MDCGAPTASAAPVATAATAQSSPPAATSSSSAFAPAVSTPAWCPAFQKMKTPRRLPGEDRARKGDFFSRGVGKRRTVAAQAAGSLGREPVQVLRPARAGRQRPQQLVRALRRKTRHVSERHPRAKAGQAVCIVKTSEKFPRRRRRRRRRQLWRRRRRQRHDYGGGKIQGRHTAQSSLRFDRTPQNIRRASQAVCIS